jgi:hypothetical protein
MHRTVFLPLLFFLICDLYSMLLAIMVLVYPHLSLAFALSACSQWSWYIQIYSHLYLRPYLHILILVSNHSLRRLKDLIYNSHYFINPI